MRSWLASEPSKWAGQVVGAGQCVAFVRAATGLGHTSTWRPGDPARGSDAPAGTAIATFNEHGRYANDTSGRSHAAIMVAVKSDGLLVWDCWLGQPVHSRVIRFRGGSGSPVNDGDAFAVILTDDPLST